ncbi:Protein AF-9 [Papilio xuthus]|uniref:Protein AF-9 n=1 Tax=Papilio xuthus TaxID=66420 RepID=A0A194PYF1_PAPXU|nr:Protein AF-9 [Papilio xuthus]
MTEGLLKKYDKPMCVRVWLEVGHACAPCRSPLGRALALDWRVWVRAARGGDLSAFVQKVVFHLHPASAFVYPKRVLHEPPYEIQESGCASLEIPIHVYLKCTKKPKKIRLRYSLHIENNSMTSTESKYVYYDFENPSEQLCTALMKGGGEIIARKGCSNRRGDDLFVLYSDDDKSRNGKRKYEFVEPIRNNGKRETKMCILEEICSKCGDSDFKKQLRSVCMTDDEINHVSQLYLAYSTYEKSVDALTLPPISDPVYSLPELPARLKVALASVKDYAIQ